MKNIYIKLMFVLFATGLFLTSCYKTFDPATYAPKFTINGFSSVNQIKSANLVGYWAFQGGLVDSVSHTSGTNSGATFVNGFIGQGLSLNVSNKSYVTATPSSALTGMGSFTLSFWVNPTFVDSNNDNGIDGALGMVNLANVNNFWGNIDFFVENGSNPTSAIVKIHIRSGALETWIVKTGVTGLFGKWSNQTVTYDATTSMFTYYINGAVAVPATAAAWTGPITFTNSGPLVFGCVQFQTNPSLGTAGGSQPWASYLTGTLDEVRIYNTALSATEVNSLVVLQGKSSQ
jgi:hypothetical protein